MNRGLLKTFCIFSHRVRVPIDHADAEQHTDTHPLTQVDERLTYGEDFLLSTPSDSILCDPWTCARKRGHWGRERSVPITKKDFILHIIKKIETLREDRVSLSFKTKPQTIQNAHKKWTFKRNRGFMTYDGMLFSLDSEWFEYVLWYMCRCHA